MNSPSPRLVPNSPTAYTYWRRYIFSTGADMRPEHCSVAYLCPLLQRRQDTDTPCTKPCCISALDQSMCKIPNCRFKTTQLQLFSFVISKMSRKYKFTDCDKLHFVTFTVVNWIDLFIRNEYKDIVINSIKFCQQHKDLEVYAWCMMTSHIHLIVGTRGNHLSNIMRDLKRHSSEMLHQYIIKNNKESRKEWLLWMMERAGKKCNNKFQLWQAESHPIELTTGQIAHQKLDYLHDNPLEAGFVTKAEEWLYSSAADYNGGKGLLEIIQLDPLIL